MLAWSALLACLVLAVCLVATSDGLFASMARLEADQQEAARAARTRGVEISDDERRAAIEDAREQRAHRRLRQLGVILVIVPIVALLVMYGAMTVIGVRL